MPYDFFMSRYKEVISNPPSFSRKLCITSRSSHGSDSLQPRLTPLGSVPSGVHASAQVQNN